MGARYVACHFVLSDQIGVWVFAEDTQIRAP